MKVFLCGMLHLIICCDLALIEQDSKIEGYAFDYSLKLKYIVAFVCVHTLKSHHLHVLYLKSCNY